MGRGQRRGGSCHFGRGLSCKQHLLGPFGIGPMPKPCQVKRCRGMGRLTSATVADSASCRGCQGTDSHRKEEMALQREGDPQWGHSSCGALGLAEDLDLPTLEARASALASAAVRAWRAQQPVERFEAQEEDREPFQARRSCTWGIKPNERVLLAFSNCASDRLYVHA